MTQYLPTRVFYPLAEALRHAPARAALLSAALPGPKKFTCGTINVKPGAYHAAYAFCARTLLKQ